MFLNKEIFFGGYVKQITKIMLWDVRGILIVTVQVVNTDIDRDIVGEQIVKSLHETYNLIIVMFFSEESIDTLAHLSSTDNERLLRLFYTLTLILTDNSKITYRKELLKYLFKTYLNLASFVVYYKRF